MDTDVKAFVEAVGARQPQPGDDGYRYFRNVFRRQNYFMIGDMFLMVKISRLENPFWGVGVQFIEFLNDLDDYLVVLLTSPRDGYFLRKKDVLYHIDRKKWNTDSTGREFKVHIPRDLDNYFSSPQKFLALTGLGPKTV